MARSPYVHDRVDDDDEVLRDGAKRTHPMMLKDGSTVELEDWQREIIWAYRFGLNDAADLHRSGPRYCTDQAALDARDQARREWIDEMQTAWQRKPRAEPRAPDVPRTMTMDEAQRIKDAAWLESVRELENAWKKPMR